LLTFFVDLLFLTAGLAFFAGIFFVDVVFLGLDFFSSL